MTAIEVERERAGPLVEKFPVFAWDRKHSENPSGYIVDTLQAVFSRCLLSNVLKIA